MRMTEYYVPTLKEDPTEAEVISHKLMLRAGLMRRLASGIFTYLPMGYKIIRKLEDIVREELNRAGALEVLMPAVQPDDLWRESGRWYEFGPEMLKLSDRKERDYSIGPTHEEVVTDLIRDEIRSYKDLPLNLYQIQTKFRDEIRPRFGVLRAREFSMKDAYSFDVDQEALEESYRKMFDAYARIFERCGLAFRTVEADTGPIGGTDSHEYMVIAETGEDEVLYCESCGYAANVERARGKVEREPVEEEEKELKKVETPEVKTIADLEEFSGYNPNRMLKTLVYDADGTDVISIVCGDDELNEIKLKNHLGVTELTLLDEVGVRRVMGTSPGSAGPVGIEDTRIVADHRVMEIRNGITGANDEGYHFFNVNPGRDFQPQEITDLRVVRSGDICLQCSNQLSYTRGIEVGHLFKLGTKYSEAMEATYVDTEGKERPMVMGCYGIGITRTMAAAIEQNHDQHGIIWPLSLSPFAVTILPLDQKKTLQVGEEIYSMLEQEGIETLLDDRDERAGIKFNDADLMGIPLRITIGGRSLAENKVEVKRRDTGEEKKVDLDEILDVTRALLSEVK